MPKTADVVIVGGGVIGCSIAYQLAQAGELRAWSSNAANWPLAPQEPQWVWFAPLWHLDPPHCPVFNLGIRSLEMFPVLADELLEAGVDPAFRQMGCLSWHFHPKR